MAFNLFQKTLDGLQKLKGEIDKEVAPMRNLLDREKPTTSNAANIIQMIGMAQQAKRNLPAILQRGRDVQKGIQEVRSKTPMIMNTLQSPKAQMIETVINATTPFKTNITGRNFSNVQTTQAPSFGESLGKASAGALSSIVGGNKRTFDNLNTAKAMLFPDRGFSTEEMESANPTYKEGLKANIKSVGEIASIFPAAVDFGAIQLSKLGNSNPEYQEAIRSQVEQAGAKRYAMTQPDSAAEAQVMRRNDYIGLLGGFSKGIASNIAKAATKKEVQNIAKMSGLKLADNVAEELAQTKDIGVVNKILEKSFSKVDETKNQVKQAKTSSKSLKVDKAQDMEPTSIKAEKEDVVVFSDNIKPGLPEVEKKPSTMPALLQGLAKPVEKKTVLKPNIRLDKLGIKEADARAEINSILEKADNFTEQRRGVQTWEDTRAAAELLVPKMIAQAQKGKVFKKGTALNAEQTTALGNVMATYQEAIDDAAKLINIDTQKGVTDIAKELKLASLRTEQYLVLQSMAGSTAEAGRTLQTHKMLKQAMSPELIRDQKLMKQVLEVSGAGDSKAIAERLAALGDDEMAKFEFVRSLNKVSASEKFANFLDWYLYSSLLSGPKTQARNLAGNALNLAHQNLIIDPAAGVVDFTVENTRRLFGKGRGRSIYVGETPAKAIGMIKGIPDGVRKSIHMWRKGYTMDDFVNTEFGRTAEFGSKIFGGKIALPLNFVSRGMSSVDQFFGTIVANSELYGLAHAAAKNKKLKGKEYDEFVQNFIDSPTPDVMEKIRDAGRRIPYQQESVAANKIGWFTENKRFKRNGKPDFVLPNPLKIVVPFVKTPTNILKENIKNTPLGIGIGIAKEFQNANPRLAMRELTKGITGSIAVAGLYSLAMEGHITGNGPKDRKQRAALYETGWRPDSIFINGKYITYKFTPLNVVLSTIGNIHDAKKYDGEDPKFGNVSFKVLSSISENSFLTGVETLLDAKDRGDASYFFNRQAGSLVPFSALSRTVAEAFDDTKRETSSAVDSIKFNIPNINLPFIKDFNREQLRPQIGLFGQEVKADKSPVKRMFDFLNISKDATGRDREVIDEMFRLGLNIPVPAKNVTLTDLKTNERVELDPDQKHKYAKDLGQTMKRTIERVMSSQEYQAMDDNAKYIYMEEKIADSKKYVDNVQFIESLTDEQKIVLGDKLVMYNVPVPANTSDVEAYNTTTGEPIDFSPENRARFYERTWLGINDAIELNESKQEFAMLNPEQKDELIRSQVAGVKSFMKEGFSILLSEGDENFDHALDINLELGANKVIKGAAISIAVDQILSEFQKENPDMKNLLAVPEMQFALQQMTSDSDEALLESAIMDSFLAKGRSEYDNFLAGLDSTARASFLYTEWESVESQEEQDELLKKWAGYEANGIFTEDVQQKFLEQIETSRALSSQAEEDTGVSHWPTPAKTITQGYSYRNGAGHTGIDIGGNFGDPVESVKSGTVVSAQWAGPYGNFIVVDHGNGLVTRYAHLQSINVKPGETVEKGQFIGEQGSTGNSSGPHLHFEVRQNEEFVNPYDLGF